MSCGLDHALDPGVAVQRDAQVDAPAQKRPQPVEVAPQEQHERRHLERTRAAGLLDRRQRRLGELHVAARTPGHHLPRLAARELVHGALGEPAGGRDVAGSHLHDAAAMVRSAQHLVGDADRVHDIEGKQRDVRGLEHVAAGVEHEIRRRVGLCAAFLAQSRQELVVELHLRDMGDLERDLAESLDAVAALLARLVLAPRHRDPRHAE